jgi:hypothetical protein
MPASPHSSPGVALIVGNGLTIDFVSSHSSNGLDLWHPGRPLSWNIHSPEDPAIKLIDRADFAWLKRGVSAAALEEPKRSDFELIQRGFVLCALDGADRTPYLEQACRFLAETYVYFHQLTDPLLQDAWRWVHWLRTNAAVLRFAVSFNYDLTLERALVRAGIPSGRLGIPDESGVPILKPHGSIDFITRAVPNHPGIRVTGSDFPQRRMETNELTGYRTERNLVLPLQDSHLRHHQAIAPGFGEWQRAAPSFGHVIIAGLSYWEADRPEIDALLDGLQRATKVTLVNPSPPPELIDAATSRGLQVTATNELLSLL